MREPLIKRAENNTSKGETYSELIKKYNEAVSNGYYGEAELIVYAFLEDRLRAFIYYSDMLDSFNSNNINDNGIDVCGSEINIKNISSKIAVIRKAVNISCLQKTGSTTFEQSLKKRYIAITKPSELKKTLRQIERWCEFRNEIIHALFNKEIESIRARFEDHVYEGMKLARKIDALVKDLKIA